MIATAVSDNTWWSNRLSEVEQSAPTMIEKWGVKDEIEDSIRSLVIVHPVSDDAMKAIGDNCRKMSTLVGFRPGSLDSLNDTLLDKVKEVMQTFDNGGFVSASAETLTVLQNMLHEASCWAPHEECVHDFMQQAATALASIATASHETSFTKALDLVDNDPPRQHRRC